MQYTSNLKVPVLSFALYNQPRQWLIYWNWIALLSGNENAQKMNVDSANGGQVSWKMVWPWSDRTPGSSITSKMPHDYIASSWYILHIEMPKIWGCFSTPKFSAPPTPTCLQPWGVQGFWENWTCLAVKIASCDLPCVKLATYLQA